MGSLRMVVERKEAGTDDRRRRLCWGRRGVRRARRVSEGGLVRGSGAGGGVGEVKGVEVVRSWLGSKRWWEMGKVCLTAR